MVVAADGGGGGGGCITMVVVIVVVLVVVLVIVMVVVMVVLIIVVVVVVVMVVVVVFVMVLVVVMMVVVVGVCEGGDSKFLYVACENYCSGVGLYISLVTMQHAQFACVPWAGTNGSHAGLWARPAKYRPVDAVRS